MHIFVLQDPSIVYNVYTLRVTGEAGTKPSWHWVWNGVHPGYQHIYIHAHIPLTINLESVINLIQVCTYLDCGKMLEYPE